VTGTSGIEHAGYDRMPLAAENDAREPIVLNFDGVESPSSSFLDELLGRLADKLGEQAFRRKVHIVNMTDRIRTMSDVVIGQRLGRKVDNGA
jgi:hypothetical protein